MKKITVTIIIFFLIRGIGIADSIDQSISKIQNKETRQEGIKELETIGAPALSKVQGLVKDKTKPRDQRIAAIVLLGKLGEMAPAQQQQLAQGQKMAVMAKQDQIDRSQVRATLQEILTNDQDKFSREASALALGYLNDNEAIPKLKEALNDQSGNVRMRAALSLARLGDTAGKEPALKALDAKDVTAQLLAVDVLEGYNDKTVIPKLEQNLNSDNVWTRIYSRLAIKRIEVKDLPGQQRLDYLREVLKDKQFEVNNWAVQELSKDVINKTTDRGQALEILKAIAKNSDIAGSYSANKALRILLEKGEITEDELK